MRKLVLALSVLLAMLVPAAALAQGIVPFAPEGQPPPGAGWMAPGYGVPGGIPMNTNQAGSFLTYVKPGYMLLKWDVRFPVPNINLNPIDAVDAQTSNKEFEEMNLDLKDSGLWVGFAGVELDATDQITLYGEAAANAVRNSIVEMYAVGRFTDSFPDFDANLVPPWEWTARDLQWWMLDGGVVFNLSSFAGLEVGFKTEHLDFKMTNPRNDTERTDITDPIVPVPGRVIYCDRI